MKPRGAATAATTCPHRSLPVVSDGSMICKPENTRDLRQCYGCKVEEHVNNGGSPDPLKPTEGNHTRTKKAYPIVVALPCVLAFLQMASWMAFLRAYQIAHMVTTNLVNLP